MRKLTTNNILIETNTYYIDNRVTIENKKDKSKMVVT